MHYQQIHYFTIYAHNSLHSFYMFQYYYLTIWRPRQLSRYRDSLRAGRSGYLIPVGGETFRIHPDLPWGSTHPPVQWVPVLSRGENARGVVLTHHPHHQCRGLKLVRAIPLPARRALVVCYRGNLYLYITIFGDLLIAVRFK